MAMVSSVFIRPQQENIATHICWSQATAGSVQPEGGSVAGRERAERGARTGEYQYGAV